jgi:CRP-like cAMP-binding protein
MNPAPSLTPDLLAKLIPVGALRPESKRDLARNATLVDVSAGKYLFRAGERSRQALYLLEGQVELRDPSGEVVGKVVGETAAAQHRLPHPSSRKLDAFCVTDVRCVAVDNHLLDVMLTWDQTDALEVGEVGSESAADTDDWMTRLLQTPAFQMVPPANLQAIFMRMQRVDAAPGQTIVTQGQAGDFFYVITEGRCIVTREQPGQKAVRLAELETGSCFGEEALISEAPRNATVTMLTRGSLMRLAKDDFRKLLNEPLTRRVSRAEGDALVESGRGRYIDVRLPSEFQNGSLQGALNIPLYMLRMRLAQLPQDKGLICICDTGRRSSVASFVLTQKGYEAYMLGSGLDDAG